MSRTEDDGLVGFLPAVAAWFRETFGDPTPAQMQGWPAIASGQNALIFAPTGSGKTLAAFLAVLDHLWRTPRRAKGVRVLYVSPLKALNQDVERNLRVPLDGILATAALRGEPLLPLHVAVRSGDTPAAERQRITRKPPDILITTPESLHLMLTSKAREVLRTISHVVVDEIHALAPNKRGVFLALLLERLEALAPGFVRIGLSATQRPLDEVARYLGGRRKDPESGQFHPRPVTIVDAGRRKDLDLLVSFPPRLEGPQPSASVWPAIERALLALIKSHRSTIIFANNRRVAERLTARLNELAEEDHGPRSEENMPPSPIARSHHGSLSPEVRRQTEELLKAGELPAVVATASLELGIDMGAVDLVCQVESPGGVARGLQRVGRAGHLVGRTSKGRLLAKTPGDLIESAALARAMLDGEVEPLQIPSNCLDILTQQVIACVAVDKMTVAAMFDLVRGAYSYRDLTPSAFDAVLRLASGRFRVEALRDLKPRISWDRVHNILRPLPGTKALAVIGGGAIPDTGHYPLYLGEGGPRLGELDEEFVHERRVGETFVLGTSTWRITAIEPQKVVVARAEGRSALMPFWRGEAAGRTFELGAAVGSLCRQVADRRDDPALLDWLMELYRLDSESAKSLVGMIGRQMRQAGAVPDDRTVLVEAFVDPAGETGLAVLTPYGHRLHHALRLILGARLRERLGIEVASLHDDDGILFRLPGTDDPPMDVFSGLNSEIAIEIIRRDLAESALFGLRFRQNAGRALLMPRPDPGKRTPLWLQRLRAKDLLQAVRRFSDFPIVVETYRECLDEDLDLPRLRTFLDSIESGEIRVATHRGEISSPFTSELVFRFTMKYMYEWDEPVRPARESTGPIVDDSELDPLLDPSSRRLWLDPDAVGRVESRLRSAGRPPRSVDEMAERLREVGDLTPSELAGPMLGFAEALRAQGRAAIIRLEGVAEPSRWVAAEEVELYGEAFRTLSDAPMRTIVGRYLRTRALVDLDDLTDRYPIDASTATDLLEALADEGSLVALGTGDDGRELWADPQNLAEVRRLSVAIRRREAVAVPPEQFAAFVARLQHVAPGAQIEGDPAVGLILDQLAGHPATVELWEKELLPRRVVNFRASSLDAALATGAWWWRATGEGRGEPPIAIVPRGFPGRWPLDLSESAPSNNANVVLAHLRERGAAFVDEIASAVGRPPSEVREALTELLRRGLVCNDRLDPLRAGGEATALALSLASKPSESRPGRPRLGSFRRRATDRPEGRWSAIVEAAGDPEASLLAWSAALLDRYGVLAREMAALDPWAPPWRDLQPVLGRAELRGELRRGYFVEGLSGIQYSLAETVDALGRGSTDNPAPVLLNTLDPANLYGSGAPFDVALLEGGTARLSRSPSNFIVSVAGRPVLICESFGKKLTGLASASEEETRAAMALLPSFAGPFRRILKVESYNGVAPLASPAAPWLSEVGFVRDPPGMAYYAGW